MSKFRKVARFVTITEKVSKSSKQQRFEALKDVLKTKKNSIAVANEDRGLNSKYEQELEIEKEMQLMYNARYEMSDRELSECGSGLESLVGDESREESIEDEGSQETDSDEEEQKKAEVKNNEGNNNKESEDNESAVLDSDIEEMLRKNKSKQTGDDENSNEYNNDDEEEEEDDDSEESVNSDLELDDVIESGDYDNSSEDNSKVSKADEEDELNYSALEEEEYDSEAFSFAGMSDPTERDSRMSHVSRISLSSNHGSTKRVEENQAVEDVIKKIPDEIILEEEEKAPSITYSKSISDIEEYESDLFDLESEDVSRKGSSTYFLVNDNSEGDFSIPRAIKSRLELANPADDCSDHNKDLDDKSEDANEAANLENQANATVCKNNNGSATDPDSKNEPIYSYDADNIIKHLIENCIEDALEGLEKFEMTKESLHEENTVKSGTLEETIKEDGHVSGAEHQSNHGEPQSNHGDRQEKNDDVLSHNDDESKTTQITIRPHIITYQQLRKKDKKLLTRKERTEIYKRSNILSRERRKLRYSRPDPEIPSYKAILNKERKTLELVNIVIADVIERSMKVIDKKESKEMAISLIDEVLEKADMEAHKRAKEKEHLEIMSSVFDDLFDMWECKVNSNNAIQNEVELSQFCTSIVHGTLIVAARNVVGTAPYYALHKTPKFKAVENKNGKIKRKKKLMTKKQRHALRRERQILPSARTAEHDYNEIERTSKRNEEGDAEKSETEENSINAMNENKVTAGSVGSNCVGCSRDEKEVEIEAAMERENAVYIEAEDDINCGLSTSQTFIRERNSKDNVDHKREDEPESSSEVQLQKKENEQDESVVTLNDLPCSDKGDYCFQWIMNYGKIPRPPLESAVKDRNIDGRKRRFVRKAKIIKEKSESEASIRLSYTKYPMAEPNVAPSLVESGASFVESGEESEVSMMSNKTLTSIESGQIEICEEPINVNSINEHFENIMRMKISEKHAKLREKEKEYEERRINFAEVQSEHRMKDEEDKLSEDENKEHKDNIRSSSQIDPEYTQISSYQSDRELSKSEKEENDDDTAESIFPEEADSDDEDERERFHTPNSEIDCAVQTEPEKEISKEKKKKQSWPPRSTIGWKNLSAAVKLSVDITEYKAQVVKLRRNRFQELSLARTDVLPVLKKSGRTRGIGSNERPKRYLIKPKSITKSNALLLPSIVIANNNRVRQRRNEVKRIVLPDINQNENFVC